MSGFDLALFVVCIPLSVVLAWFAAEEIWGGGSKVVGVLLLASSFGCSFLGWGLV